MSSGFGQNWKIIDKDQELMRKNFYNAMKLEQRGQNEQALEIYRHLFQYEPENDDYYKKYSELLFKLKKYNRLEIVVKKSLEHNPDNPRSIIDLGQIYFLQQDTVKAYKYWKKCLKTNNYSEIFINQMYYTFIKLGINEKAKKLLLDGRKIHKNNTLFSRQLGDHYFSDNKFIDSAIEYLKFFRQNKNNEIYVSNMFFKFPNDEITFNAVDSLFINELSMNNDVRLRKIRADFLFRNKDYSKVTDEVFIIESMTGNSGKYIMKLAEDVLKERENQTAENIYARIIASSEFEKIVPEALLGIANSAEQNILQTENISPMKYLYTGNIFFNTDFIYDISDENKDLRKAFDIYDSLGLSLENKTLSANSLYRLASLRFYVINDYDGAFDLFEQAEKYSNSTNFKNDCFMHKIKIMIAKGDIEPALELLNKKLTTRDKNFKKTLIVYKIFSEYIVGDLDTLLNQKTNLLRTLGINSKYFNDVFELMNFLEDNYNKKNELSKKAFRLFLKGEFLIHRNNLSEAGAVYNYIIQNFEDTPIIEVALFRLAQVDLQFNYLEGAEQTVEVLISKKSKYADNAVIMLADICMKKKQFEKAKKWYKIILLDYPKSFYSDTARKNLRKL